MKAHHFLAILGLLALPAYLYCLYTGQADLDSTWGAFAVLITIFSMGHLLGQAVDVEKIISRVQRRAERYGGSFEERLEEKLQEKQEDGKKQP